MIIAIDGPAGAGKGTVAREIARRLKYRYVDTGAMYRAAAWKARRTGVPFTDGPSLASMVRTMEMELDGEKVGVDGQDVTQDIRTRDIDQAAALVARQPEVRQILVERQRSMGSSGSVVMEGRDIGTVVFPDADVKIFLDATPDERARRRAVDPFHQRSSSTDFSEVAAALNARDVSDSTRLVSPLAIAPDAVRIDTTGVPIDEVVSRVLTEVTRRVKR